MYQIIKENKVLAIVGTPTWVRMQDNGSFGLSTQEQAHGVVVNGMVYHVEGCPGIEGTEDVSVIEIDDGVYANSLTALLFDPTELKNAEQFRKVVQFFAGSLDEEKAQAVASIYDPYEVDHAYAVGDYFTCGTNNVGDPQLYKVVQPHTSQADWKPDALPALYTPIGLTDTGYAVWSQPAGSHDAYDTGDIVSYNGTLYRSLIDGNTRPPDAYPAGWEIYTEE